jgi:hypothetical protein
MLGAFSLRNAAADYDELRVGKLQGKVLVQWIEPNKFIFIPDSEQPLIFVRSTGEIIAPKRMLTDGGSIPRAFWILRNYSPWGYAPAFIIHDWLFVTKHCNIPGYEKYTYDEAATVMAEIMKTMMETGRVDVDKATVMSMYYAVRTPIASREWNEGRCIPPPSTLGVRRPILEYELTFP